MRLAIISDTHMPRGGRRLPPACITRCKRAELIIHAGDFATLAVHDQLAALGPPLVAVHGNVDDAELRAALPERTQLELDGGVRIGVIHDAGAARGRLARLRGWFGEADAVVFGHSHLPLHERSDQGFQIFNPGSPTERRRAPTHTMGVATIARGRISFRIVEVG